MIDNFVEIIVYYVAQGFIVAHPIVFITLAEPFSKELS
jgi:hypothetical protein